MTYGARAVDNPDAFVGKVTLSAYEPYPVLTASQYSSIAPAQAAFIKWNQPGPLGVKNIVLQNSLGVSVPGATSQASSGSEAFSYVVSAYLYSRQDYAGNSSNMFPLLTASFGLTATLSYTSTAQTFGMSWVTDTTGGASNFTTTSADGGWSNFASGAKVYSVPMVTNLTAGEYWIGFQHSSTTATSNSNVTLLSMSQLILAGQQGGPLAGLLGASVTVQQPGGAFDVGVVLASPTTSTTMAISTLSAAARPIWFALSNA